MDFKRGVLEILLRRIRPEQISLHTSKGYNDYRGAKKEFFLPAVFPSYLLPLPSV